MREPAGVLFLVDQDIVGLSCPQTVKPNLHGSMIVIEFDVKERGRVRAPHHPALGFFNEIGEILACGPIAYAYRKIFRALDVGAPCLEPVIGRMTRTTEFEVLMTGGKLIAVENDLGFAAIAR